MDADEAAAQTDPMTAADGDAMEDTLGADLGSQPLDELGVSVMDQDVLEREVVAQVSPHCGTP
jgi:hypothetical protein